ncbi:formamidopyrimidine-DNA glycosylase [Haloactinopolyspora alba]|uniref:Formamidopyrimidine-DNA glycosylase n=1 Tax=Haloactinopolyspora alba TaxID=648780 RepID=A0A2P8EBX3_9ACTN|nr:formamidopyrimidine-DNA glycosylase [Haloactinopolyspora alba]
MLDQGVLRGLDADELRDALVGARLCVPRRHGKWLIAAVRSGERHDSGEPSVLFHFGMTGSLSWHDAHEQPPPARHRHDRVVMVTTGGELRYRDMRKLRGIHLARSDADVDEMLSDIGPDAARITPAGLSRPLRHTDRRLKPALLDQHLIAGLGNLLVDEILWRARLRPDASASSLSDGDWRRLHRRMRTVLARSCAVGRVPDHRSWLTGRRDDPDGVCPRCESTLEHTQRGGRTTVLCPHCQPA